MSSGANRPGSSQVCVPKSPVKESKEPCNTDLSYSKERPTDFGLLFTAGADAVVHVHNVKDGSLKASFQKAEQLPRVHHILPTSIPLVLLQGEEGAAGAASGGAGSSSGGVQVFSLEDFTSKGFLTLPALYKQGAVRQRVHLPVVGGELGEMAGVILQDLPPPKPPPAEGEEEPPQDGEVEKDKGKSQLVAFRLIDMLALAFANMVKTQFGSWIQTSAKDTYWSQAGVGLARTAGNAVSDRYLRDAAVATGVRSLGSPRNLARQGTGISPRRDGRTSMNSPGRMSPLMGASRGGAASPLAGAHTPLRRQESSSSLKGLLKSPLAAGGGRAKTGGVVPSYSSVAQDMGNASPGAPRRERERARERARESERIRGREGERKRGSILTSLCKQFTMCKQFT